MCEAQFMTPHPALLTLHRIHYVSASFYNMEFARFHKLHFVTAVCRAFLARNIARNMVPSHVRSRFAISSPQGKGKKRGLPPRGKVPSGG